MELSRRTRIVLLILGLFAAVLFFVLVWVVGNMGWAAWKGTWGEEITREGAFDIATKSTIGAAGIIGAAIATWRASVLERQLAQGQLKRLDERFGEAAVLIGHERMSTRIAGVLALERLLKEDHFADEHWTIVQLLVAFVERAPRPGERDRPKQEFLVAASVLGRRPHRPEGAFLHFGDVDLRGVKLCNAYLPKANLSGACLSEADMSGAVLEKANLFEANLVEANLRGANLRGAALYSESGPSEPGGVPGTTNLCGADLREADLTDANLEFSHLSRADLRGAKLLDSNLFFAKLRNAKISGADLARASLDMADLYQANLSKANLGEADLDEADLTGANLDGAYLGKANLSKANLSKANLSKANLSKANLSKADLTGADLTGANLMEAVFTGVVGFTYEQALSAKNCPEDILKALRGAQPASEGLVPGDITGEAAVTQPPIAPDSKPPINGEPTDPRTTT